MSQQLPPLTPMSSSSTPTPPLTWTEAWSQALLHPSVATFENIANSASASSNTAYLWLFVAATITSAIGSIGNAALYSNAAFRGSPYVPGGGSVLTGLICAPVAGAIAVLITAVLTLITQAIAGALGGTGSYEKLIYATAAFSAPLSMISSVLGLIPVVGLLTFILGIYGIVLQVTAVKAVNQFGWGKAILSSIVIWACILVLVAVVIIVILALLGPSIGTVFSNIIQGL